jgi:hypothetical protein
MLILELMFCYAYIGGYVLLCQSIVLIDDDDDALCWSLGSVMLMLELMFYYADSIVLTDVDDALCWTLCFVMLIDAEDALCWSLCSVILIDAYVGPLSAFVLMLELMFLCYVML